MVGDTNYPTERCAGMCHTGAAIRKYVPGIRHLPVPRNKKKKLALFDSTTQKAKGTLSCFENVTAGATVRRKPGRKFVPLRRRKNRNATSASGGILVEPGQISGVHLSRGRGEAFYGIGSP